MARHHRDEVVPLRKVISEENQLRYNGMLISVFELLADAREQVSAVTAAIDAQQQFWLADAAMQASVIGRPTNTTLVSHIQRAQCGRCGPLKQRFIVMTSRRDFFKFAGIAGGAVAASSVSRVAMAALPEPVIQTSPNTMAPLVPNSGRPYNPVVTLNGWTLPWRMNQGVKEFHLVAEPVVREMAPGFKAHLWGYNGQSPGPNHRSGGRRSRSHFRDQQAA